MAGSPGPGNPWHEGDKFILDPKVDGLFYWLSGERRITGDSRIRAAGQIQHTWMSPNTLGEESTVTVTFKKKGRRAP